MVGARLESWNGGLVGAYGGLLCGMCLGGGLAGITSRHVDPEDRAETLLGLVFGVFATAGAVTGYWIGTLDIPRFSPLAGFFVGLILPGAVATLTVAKILGDRAEPAVLLLLLFAPTGAGLGAWLGTAVESPVLVAIGLIVGSLLGGAMGHMLNVAAHHSVYGADDPVARHHGDGAVWGW